MKLCVFRNNVMTASDLPFAPSDYDKKNPPTPQTEASGQGTAELMSTMTPTSTLFGPTSQDRSSSKPAGSVVRPAKAIASRNRDTRLPAARTGSVFERLYKTQTASSAASKAWTPVRAEARRGGTFSSPPLVSSGSRFTPPSAKSDKELEDSLKVFQRLHITGTVSNTSKRLTPKRHTPNRGMRSPAKIIASTPTPIKSASKRGTVGYVYSPRMKPLTALYFDSKYHPGIGREKVDPLKLGYTFFQMLCEYENGGLTSAQIAREIIIAFFKKDFPSGR